MGEESAGGGGETEEEGESSETENNGELRRPKIVELVLVSDYYQVHTLVALSYSCTLCVMSLVLLPVSSVQHETTHCGTEEHRDSGLYE